MSGFFDDDEAEDHPHPRTPTIPRRSRTVIATVVVLVVVIFAISIFDGIYTDRLWYGSVRGAPAGSYTGVFTKMLGTRVLLFVVFGVLMGGILAGNIVLAYRFRPMLHTASTEQANLDRYRDFVDPLRRWLLIAVSVIAGLFAAGSGAGQWRSFLLWRHRVSFGSTDAYFHRDIGFYVFSLPWLHYLVHFGMAVSILALVAAAVTHYLFGGIRLQSRTDRMSGPAQAQLSVLLGFFVLFKAADYYLSRFDLNTGGGLFTGMGYTDAHAVLPSRNILMFIALICGLLFFANVVRRTWMLPSVGLALLVLSAILLGAIWPAIVQRFQVHPSEIDREAPYLARNIQASRTAYGIAGTKVIDYDAKQTLQPQQLKKDAQSIPGIRLLDPALVRPAFEQLQQVRGFYTMARVLDVDRYPVHGRLRDVVIAVREINLAGLPPAQRNWTNEHTVYTHGYGVVAAFGNQRNAQDQPVTNNDGKPVWAEQDLPPRGVLPPYQPRIYFGENSPAYSIVGEPPGHPGVELDLPATQGANPKTNVYQGTSGVPIGGTFNKLMYALHFSDANIFLSSRVNSASQILYNRDPISRVQKVAPWLVVDRDPYPAVVDGRIKWIMDCYTTTDSYPNSESRSLSEMTSDSLLPRSRYATLPHDDINYMRNSVKAVVDAYSGKVTLYAWDRDPILRAWSAAFPHTVTARSKIPPDLLAHMRYPEDLFKVQRNILATYHVQNPRTFYGASDKWRVPQDPEHPTQNQPPYRLSVRTPGEPKPVFSLTSVYTPNKRQNLAAFISVDSDPSLPDYGTIRILRLPSTNQTPGPSQIANNFHSDPAISRVLLAFSRTGSRAKFGNLLTLPVGDGLLYVQPLYTERQSGQGNYPVLRYVVASFGQDVGIGTTLTEALDNVLGIAPTPTNPTQPTQPPTTGNGGGTQPPPSGTVSQGVRNLLKRADIQFAKAKRALKAGDLTGYAQAEGKAQSLVRQALKLATQQATKSGTKSSTKSSG